MDGKWIYAVVLSKAGCPMLYGIYDSRERAYQREAEIRAKGLNLGGLLYVLGVRANDHQAINLDTFC